MTSHNAIPVTLERSVILDALPWPTTTPNKRTDKDSRLQAAILDIRFPAPRNLPDLQ